MQHVTPDAFVHVDLCVARTGSTIRGTVARAELATESFTGWLGLTAAVARTLDAVDGVDPPNDEHADQESESCGPGRRHEL